MNFKNFIINWKTSGTGILMIIAGIAAALHVQVQGVSIAADPTTLIMGGIGLLFAKDGNVTGGTTTQPTVANPVTLVEH